jgi:hypothetical protein
MTRRIAALFFAWMATLAHAQTAALTDDEAAVVARAYVLTRAGGPEKTVILPEETANFQCTGNSGVKLGGCAGGMKTKALQVDDVMLWVSKEFASVASPELVADFRNKAMYSARISKTLPMEAKQVIGEPAKLDESGRPYLVLDFSRVAFNPAKTEALVYLASVSQIDAKRSYGEYLCFRLDEGVWKLAGRARNWALK